MRETLRQLALGLAGIVLALAAGAVALAARGQAPLDVYRVLFRYAAGSWYDLSNSLHNAVPLILTGLAAAVGFGAGVVNLGQQGQLLVGALATALVGVALPLPRAPALAVGIAAGMLAGALWGALAAWMRHRLGMDEFITTLMLNFVAVYATGYLVTYPLMDPTAYTPMTVQVLPAYWLPRLSASAELDAGVLLAGAAVLAMALAARYTPLGYEWRMMGLNALAAKLAGIDTARNVSLALWVGGALSGLAGALLVMGGVQHRFVDGMAANYAWDGIMVAIIGQNGVVATTLYALFFGALQTGSLGMEFEVGVPSEFSMVVQALVVVFAVAGPLLLDRTLTRWALRRVEKEVVSPGAGHGAAGGGA
ncbi:MAG: ABC transporter permease [Limnochordaceae bacterium]|nr:ABC transporter permease [Limnochordaceae bacterium]